MTINIAGLDEVMAHIEAHPETWDQETYRCETGMCVAGWRAQLSGGEWAFPADDNRWFPVLDAYGCWDGEVRAPSLLVAEPGDEITYQVEGRTVTDAHNRAQKLLGLTELQAARLFTPGNRLEDIRMIVAQFKAQAESEAS